jgi:hypothetical protein
MDNLAPNLQILDSKGNGISGKRARINLINPENNNSY